MGVQIEWEKIQPNLKWTILSQQKGFAAWAIFTSIGSMMLGFDFGLAGTLTAFAPFQVQYGHPYAGTASGYLIRADIQSGWNGVSTVGDIVGIIISGYLLEWIGRKHTLGIGAVLTAAGVGIQIGVQTWRGFLVGRFVNATGFGIVFLVTPVFIGEVCRPEVRGTFLCIINGSIVFGQLILALAANFCAMRTDKWSYQIMILLQFVFCAILLAGYPFFPDSPFYFLNRNQPEKARRSLNKIHGSSDQRLIEAELVRLQEMVKSTRQMQELAAESGPLMLQTFKGKNLKRTLTACLMAGAQQLIGSAFVLGYITYFMQLIHVSHYFTVSVVLFVIMLLSNISAFFVIEYVGRRKLLLYGVIGLTLTELLMGIMGCINASGAIWVILVSIFLWAIIYQMSVGAVGFALAAEVPTARLRPATMSLVGFTQGATGWTIGFVVPYMINPDAGNLGAKVGFVFFGLGIPLSIAFFFLVPETRSLSFEELDHLYNNKVSPRKFQQVILVEREQEAELGVMEHSKPDRAVVSEVEKCAPPLGQGP
ncbi:hypothetical protein LTR46_008948 [Exophiala xenobiotica]|nr:hypothetical protein LTR46_008948 [Exophiala xenobiotica]